MEANNDCGRQDALKNDSVVVSNVPGDNAVMNDAVVTAVVRNVPGDDAMGVGVPGENAVAGDFNTVVDNLNVEVSRVNSENLCLSANASNNLSAEASSSAVNGDSYASRAARTTGPDSAALRTQRPVLPRAANEMPNR